MISFLFQTLTDEIIYCQHVERLTSQYIEQHQSQVTLHIFVERHIEPIKLEQISLQSTVAHVLDRLLESIKFDYDRSILKLRSREEYLRHTDVLCDIEYIYQCLTSLKQLQFTLVKRPTRSILEIPSTYNLSFEQFYIDQYDSFIAINGTSLIKPVKPLQLTKSLSKSKSNDESDRTNSQSIRDCQWFEFIRKLWQSSLEHIEERFNRLVNPSLMATSINEKIQLADELFHAVKNIQKTCSNIQSSVLIEKQNEIQDYMIRMSKKSTDSCQTLVTTDTIEYLTRLMYEYLGILVTFIQTYCMTYAIPYEVEIYHEKIGFIDSKSWQSTVNNYVRLSL
jgi:hypothetical protein